MTNVVRAVTVMLALVVTLWSAGMTAGGGPAWAQTGLAQVEVWPRGAAEGDATKRLPDGITAAVRKAAPAGSRVEQYLFAKLEDGSLMVGIDPVNTPARTPRAAFRPKLVAGRAFRADDREKIVAIVSRQYAETHKTATGYKVSEMVYPGHTPGLTFGKTRVEIVGIFEGGSADADQLVIVPLALARTLGNAPDALSLVSVTLRSPADADALEKALEAELKDKADVRVRK